MYVDHATLLSFAVLTPHLPTPSSNRAAAIGQRYDRDRLPERRPSDLDQMKVVREEKNLGSLRELAQDADARSRTLIIEIDEKIVGDEWERARPLKVIFDRCHAKREVELIGGARAHALHANLLGIRADSDEVGVVLFVELKPKVAE